MIINYILISTLNEIYLFMIWNHTINSPYPYHYCLNDFHTPYAVAAPSRWPIFRWDPPRQASLPLMLLLNLPFEPPPTPPPPKKTETKIKLPAVNYKIIRLIYKKRWYMWIFCDRHKLKSHHGAPITHRRCQGQCPDRKPAKYTWKETSLTRYFHSKQIRWLTSFFFFLPGSGVHGRGIVKCTKHRVFHQNPFYGVHFWNYGPHAFDATHFFLPPVINVQRFPKVGTAKWNAQNQHSLTGGTCVA